MKTQCPDVDHVNRIDISKKLDYLPQTLLHPKASRKILKDGKKQTKTCMMVKACLGSLRYLRGEILYFGAIYSL